MRDVVDWLSEHMATLKPLYSTRLPYIGPGRAGGPDGIFIPRQVTVRVVPRVFWAGKVNPSEPIEMTMDSHAHSQTIRAVWYNSQYRGGRRNETRMAGFDPDSVLLDPESTGAMLMFAFDPATKERPATCRVWMCETAAEEARAENLIGPADPHFGGALWPHIFERLDWPPRAND